MRIKPSIFHPNRTSAQDFFFLSQAEHQVDQNRGGCIDQEATIRFFSSVPLLGDREPKNEIGTRIQSVALLETAIVSFGLPIFDDRPLRGLGI